MKRALFVLGTRPEIIKLSPVVREMANSGKAKPFVAFTSQHADLGQQFLSEFGIEADFSLKETPDEGPRLPAFFGHAVSELAKLISDVRPSVVTVQGDTISALAGAVAAFLTSTPLTHVEAGLRTSDINMPYPEEWSRRAIDLSSRIYFAPTDSARNSLIGEGYDQNSIVVTGNTGIDAVRLSVERDEGEAAEAEKLRLSEPYVLVTLHRREMWGSPSSIRRSILPLLTHLPGLQFYAVDHPNGKLRAAIQGSRFPNLQILPPQPFHSFVRLLKNCSLAISDSGGVQEEATFLSTPLIILRTNTERQEALESPNIHLRQLGDDLLNTATLLLSADRAKGDPYRFAFGDGHAASRIVSRINSEFQ